MISQYELLDELEHNIYDGKVSIEFMKGLMKIVAAQQEKIQKLQQTIHEHIISENRNKECVWQMLSDITDHQNPKEALINLVKQVAEDQRKGSFYRKRSRAESQKDFHNSYMNKIKQEQEQVPSISDGTFER